ncbi:kinase-like domain-containing protein [Scenedesmus sp. NREL 46B-D3]|nr:kinase-like domain-containing protein [Scenedesmus sp. NREL 46B-D3]
MNSAYGCFSAQVKTVLSQLGSIHMSNGFAATCGEAAQVLHEHLVGAESVSITTHTSSSPNVCVLAGTAGAGAELLQRQLVMSGSSWSACLCCMQTDSPILYRSATCEEEAKALPQDWHALYHEAGMRTFLAMHISVAGQDMPIGVLSLASSAPAAFMEDSWGSLLGMICTGLVPLLTSPWLAGLSGLAANLIDSSSSGFASFAAAFLSGSAQLLEATTHKQLGCTSPCLLSGDLCDGSRTCEDAAADAAHTFASFGSFDMGLDQLRMTRLAARNTLLLDAVNSGAPAFIADAHTVLEDGEPAIDMVDVGSELVASMVVVPLFDAACTALGALYVTSPEAGSYLKSSPVAAEQASMLQSMLQQHMVKLPTDWVQLQASHCCDRSSNRSTSSDMSGPSTPHATTALPSSHSAQLAVLHSAWSLQDKQQGCQQEYLSELQLYSVLGRGGFSTVYAGTWHGSRTAIKVMRVAHDDTMGIPIKSAMEMAAMSSLKHPNIVSTYACLTDMVEERRPAGSASSKQQQPLNLCFRKATASDLTEETRDTYNIVVMERCDRGNLWTAIRQENLLHRRLPDGRLKINMRLLHTVLLDVAHSLRYLHSMGMVHLDIKAENVLLQTASGRPNGFVCKLGDFGLVKLLGDRAFLKNCDSSGTLTHLAPERFQAGSMLTAAADAYSFGVLMYELYTGSKPYKSMQPGPALARSIFQGLSLQLAEDCWACNIADRPSMDAIVQRLQKDLGLVNGQGY